MIRGTAPSDGLLRLDKSAGPTSHDMVAWARRELRLRKVGHTGTLDPFASGLLLLCLGPSTRLAEYLSELPKEYRARARLGVRTSSGDPDGDALATSDGWRTLGRDEIESTLESFLGESDQVPPTFSAKKVDGERAYRRARRGESVSLEPVPVQVHEVALETVALPFIDFRLRCSAGTYVRAIARDLGEWLGVGAHLTELRRVSIGPFSVQGAVSPEALGDPAAVRSAWIPPLGAVRHLPVIQDPPDEALHRFRSGQPLPPSELGAPEEGGEGEVAVAVGDRLVAIAVRDGDRIRPRKVFPLE